MSRGMFADRRHRSSMTRAADWLRLERSVEARYVRAFVWLLVRYGYSCQSGKCGWCRWEIEQRLGPK